MQNHPGKIITTEATEDVWKFEYDWSSGLCDCLTNCKKCCFAYFCYPCFACSIFRRTGECLCTPLFTPFALMSLRSKLRTGFRLKGSICEDFLATLFCPFCSILQISNELDSQGL